MFCLGGDLKNIIKNRVFLSGAVVSIFLTVFYFYQYLNVFQLSDNPSENKKYVQFSSDLNKIISGKKLSNYERKIIVGDIASTTQILEKLLTRIESMDLSIIKGTDDITKRLENILKGSDIDEYISEMKKEKRELLKQVVSFRKLSEKNKWPTLIKISTNVVDRVSKLDLNTNLNDINADKNSISKDVNYMERITNVSSIDKKSKEIIKERIDDINKNLDRYQKTLAPFGLLVDEMRLLISGLTKWNKRIEEKAAGNLIVIENKEMNISAAKWHYLGALLITLGGLYFFTLMSMSLSKKRESEKVLEVIKDSLFSNDLKDFSLLYGEDFNEKISKYRAYLAKRMSFGSIFQDTIPFCAAIFKGDHTFHWCNSEYRQTGMNQNSLKELYVELNMQWADLEENVTLKRSASFNESKYTVFVTRIEFQNDVFYVFYGIKSQLEIGGEKDSDLNKVIESLEDESIIVSSPSDDITPDELVKMIVSQVKNGDRSTYFQNQLDELEDQVIDYHKINSDISKFCFDIDNVSKEMSERNNQISRSLLSIISSKEELESNNEIHLQNIKNLRGFNQKIIESIETLVKDIYELKELTGANEISYGQLKQEVENIYNFLANLEVPEEISIDINRSQEDRESIDSEIKIAELLNEQFSSTASLLNKLQSINEMLSAQGQVNKNIGHQETRGTEV